MIFLKAKTLDYYGICLEFRLERKPVISETIYEGEQGYLYFKSLWHFYIVFKIWNRQYYMGINRVKRIKKDKLYEIDGIKIYGDGKGGYSLCRKKKNLN